MMKFLPVFASAALFGSLWPIALAEEAPSTLPPSEFASTDPVTDDATVVADTESPISDDPAQTELVAPPSPTEPLPPLPAESPDFLSKEAPSLYDQPVDAMEETPPQTVMQYDFNAVHAAPPDITLAIASPFSFGPGYSRGRGVHPFFSVGIVYDDNIFLEENNEEGDLILSATAGIQAEFGHEDRGFAVGYALSGFLFTDHSDANSLNHDAWVAAHRRFSKTSLAFAGRLQRLSGSDRDIGGYTERDSATASLNATHELAGKTRLNAALEHTTLLYDDFNDSFDTLGRLGLDYEVSPKTRVGIQGVLGYLAVDNGADQVYEQANMTFNYEATGKVTVAATAGWEWRQWDGEGGDDSSPVYSLGLNWRPRESTSIWVRGARRTYASALYDNVVRESTNIEVSLSQRILNRFAFTLASGYEHAEYDGPATAEGAGRDDDYFYIRPSVSVGLTPHIWSTFFYEYRHNDSNGGSSFENSRVGAQIGYSF